MEKSELNQIFSDNLVYWLNQREKSQADLARRMKVSTATASDWCNCNKLPRTDKLVEISRWLRIELSDLLCEKERVPVSNTEKAMFLVKDEPELAEILLKLHNLKNKDASAYEKVLSYIEWTSQYSSGEN